MGATCSNESAGIVLRMRERANSYLPHPSLQQSVVKPQHSEVAIHRKRMASVLWVALLATELSMLANPGSSVAPGDEEPLCEQLRFQGAAPTPTYSANMRVLMDSWNYQNVLSPRIGAVWGQVDNDTSNLSGETTNVGCIHTIY